MRIYWKGSVRQRWEAINYYWLLLCVYLIAIYIPTIGMGVAMSILLLFLWLNVSIRQSSYNSSLVFLYLCYILVSIQGYLYNGIPISVYLSELGTQVLPIIFFFIAFSFSDEEKEKFYKTYIYAISLSLIIGLFFYIFPSAQYSAYISSHFSSNYDSQLDYINYVIRFASLFGSVATGSLSVFLFIITFYSVFIKKENNNTLQFVLMIVLGATSAFMTLQRSAMAMLLFSAFVLIIFSLKSHSLKSLSLLLLFSVLVLTGIYYASEQYGLFFENLSERINDMGGALSERDVQWKETFRNSKNIVFGTGIGSAGHHAIGYTKYYIADGGLFTIVAELGFVGASIFFLLIFNNLYQGRRFRKFLLREYLIVIVCLVQSIGSNTLMFQNIAPIFWFCLGVISSRGNRNLIRKKYLK